MPVALDHLPIELLLAIVTYLDEPADFAASRLHPNGTPALKNLSVCSRRLHAVASPTLFQSIRLVLNVRTALLEIQKINSFLISTGYISQVARIAVVLGHQWNSGTSCFHLKKFLHDLRIRSLCLRQDRPGTTVREKSARWFGNLNELRKLRLETIDDVNLPTMLLVQKAPIEILEVEDGSCTERTDWTLSRGNKLNLPGIGALKPQLFIHLRKILFTSFEPSTYRVRGFLVQFMRKLPVLRELDVEFARCGFPTIERAKGNILWWARTTDAGKMFVDMITIYEILAMEVESMMTLDKIKYRDWKWLSLHESSDFGRFHPSGFIELSPGMLVRGKGGLSDRLTG